MDYKHNKSLVPLAKTLRRDMTKEERHLWYDFLRDYPVRFQRQKIVGNAILDFYCAKANIAIELDGSQHYQEDGLKKDQARTMFLQQYGIWVIRIANNQVNQNFQGVCQYIDMQVKQALSQQS